MSSRFSFGRSGTESRTNTASGSSSGSRPSIRGRAPSWRDKEKKKKLPRLVEGFYTRYGLDWDDLRTWLQNRFPGCKFDEQCDISGDYYKFMIPRKLTQDEKDQIESLRKDRQQGVLVDARATAGNPNRFTRYA